MSDGPGGPATPATDLVLRLVTTRPARLGGSRLVCVDGPAGAGKTTLAGDLVRAARRRGLSTSLVHLDDVYDGWSGLTRVGPTLHRDVVAPLASGAPGRYRRYDWHREEYAEECRVAPADLVVLEGVGAGHPGYAAQVTLLVWVDAPDEVRLRRGLARDGEHLEPRWRAWMRDEGVLFARELTRERADVLVDGLTGLARTAPGPAETGQPAAGAGGSGGLGGSGAA